MLDSSDESSARRQKRRWRNDECSVQRTIPLTIVVDGADDGRAQRRRLIRQPSWPRPAQPGRTGLHDPHAGHDAAGRRHPARRARARRTADRATKSCPIQTVYQPSADLDLDTKAQLSPGTPGLKQRVTRVRYEDGQEVSRVDEGEIIVQEPINEVIGYGTRITHECG